MPRTVDNSQGYPARLCAEPYTSESRSLSRRKCILTLVTSGDDELDERYSRILPGGRRLGRRCQRRNRHCRSAIHWHPQRQRRLTNELAFGWEGSKEPPAREESQCRPKPTKAKASDSRLQPPEQQPPTTQQVRCYQGTAAYWFPLHVPTIRVPEQADTPCADRSGTSAPGRRNGGSRHVRIGRRVGSSAPSSHQVSGRPSCHWQPHGLARHGHC